MAAVPQPNIVSVVLPDIQDVLAVLPRDLADDEDELLARVRLTFLNTHATAEIEDLDAAIGVLRARAAGNATAIRSARESGPRATKDWPRQETGRSTRGVSTSGPSSRCNTSPAPSPRCKVGG